MFGDTIMTVIQHPKKGYNSDSDTAPEKFEKGREDAETPGSCPVSLMPPLLGATGPAFPTMPESGKTMVEQLLDVQKKSAPSKSVHRT